MSTYIERIKIPYYHVDKDKKLTSVNMLKYLNEISIKHNNDKQKDKIKNNNFGWMINKWKVQIDEYPFVEEEIEIVTWISRVERFFVNREFKVLTEDGRVISYGTAEWIFIDLLKRRPKRLEKNFLDKNTIIEKAYFTEFVRFPKNLGLEKIDTYKVRRLDIDMNNHVNNVNYFVWMLEAVEDHIYNDYDLKNLEIDYKKEITYPSKVSSWKKNYKDGDEIEIIHGIYDELNGANSTLGKTIWKKTNKEMG